MKKKKGIVTFPPAFYRLSTKVLITDKLGRVLVMLVPNGKFDLPGGGVEHGEDIHDALRREVREEIGGVVKTVEKYPTYVWTQERDHEGYFAENFHAIFLAYRVTLRSLKLSFTTHEAVGYRFVTKKELQKLKMVDTVQKFPGLFNPKDFA